MFVVLESCAFDTALTTGMRESAGNGSVVRLTSLDDHGMHIDVQTVTPDALPAAVAVKEREHPRWVFDATSRWYPELLRAGVRIERSHDLALCHTILRRSAFTAGTRIRQAPRGPWDDFSSTVAAPEHDTLAGFDALGKPHGTDLDSVEELRMQLEALDASSARRLRLLLAAESCGALIAAEMRHDGLPWRTDIHDRLLTELLGPRPTFGGRPRLLETLAAEIRMLLEAPRLNPDSQQDLLKALKRAGLGVTSTSKWELREQKHPVVAPLLQYKRLSRLLSANGWVWMDEWIRDGRFHPEYVVGGVVTGRWATNGGGALQLPSQIRAAVTADEGWKLVVADAAQLEPRIVAAMAGDARLAQAGAGKDLYQGFVDAGIVDDRAHAKVAMLGALYGATTGESGRLMPRLMKAFPRATGLVEAAARAGERGEQVSTWLGRSSPLPGEDWQLMQREASGADAAPDTERRARQSARDWGRFTRNFVAQGTAAEWALCWMAGLRQRLAALMDGDARPHLVFFLHDEVVVHAPDHLASQVSAAVTDAAADAGRLLFGDFPIDFPLNVTIADNYAEAKG